MALYICFLFFETGSLLNLKLKIHSFWEYIFTGYYWGWLTGTRQCWLWPQLAFTWVLKTSFQGPHACTAGTNWAISLGPSSLSPRVCVCTAVFMCYIEIHITNSSFLYNHMTKMLKDSYKVQNVVNRGTDTKEQSLPSLSAHSLSVSGVSWILTWLQVLLYDQRRYTFMPALRFF